MTDNKYLQFALRYAELGIPVLQLAPKSKAPATKNGFHDATTDAETIKQWWHRSPNGGVGIYPFGAGWAVLDVDTKQGGKGPEQLAELEARHGPLPSTLEARTPSGATHLIFRCNTELGNHKIAPDIDVRCANGYIAVEPTTLSDSSSYYWIDWDVELEDKPEVADLPNWIIHLSQEAAKRSAESKAAEEEAPEFIRPTNLLGLGVRLESFLSQAPKARYRWQGGTDGLIDVSGSGMDFSMCAILKAGGFEYSEVVILMSDWPHGSRNKQRNTERYWQRLWTRTSGEDTNESDVVINLSPKADELKIKTAPTPEEIPVPDDLLNPPGVVGAMAEWIEETARKAQPQFSVQAALAFACTVLGRRYVTDQRNWPSMFFMNIGKSASGKEHAKWAIEKALDACDLGHLIGPASYTSDSGMMSSLMMQPSHITIIDEIGMVLEEASSKNNSRAGSTLRALMEVWGRCDGTLRPQGYSTFGMSARDVERLSERVIRNPSLTLLAMTTPEKLFDTVGASAARDGFLNRFLMVESSIGRQPARSVVPSNVPSEVISWSQRVRDKKYLTDPDRNSSMEPAPTIVPINSEAVNLFDMFELECIELMDKHEKDGMAEMFGRTREMAMKLALVVAVGCDSTEVNTEHAAWAINYTRYYAQKTVDRLKSSIGDSEFDALKRRVYDIILRSGDRGATVREIARRCSAFNRITMREQEEALESMAYLGDITYVKQVSSNGRTRESWVAVDNQE